MKRIINNQLINKKINESIQWIINENIRENEPILSNIDAQSIYECLESDDKLFSFYKKKIINLGLKKIKQINEYLDKHNLDEEVHQVKIWEYINKYYRR